MLNNQRITIGMNTGLLNFSHALSSKLFSRNDFIWLMPPSVKAILMCEATEELETILKLLSTKFIHDH